MDYLDMDYLDMEPDPEVLENPGFVVELNRRFEEASLFMYSEILPLKEYESEAVFV